MGQPVMSHFLIVPTRERVVGQLPTSGLLAWNSCRYYSTTTSRILRIPSLITCKVIIVVCCAEPEVPLIVYSNRSPAASAAFPPPVLIFSVNLPNVARIYPAGEKLQFIPLGRLPEHCRFTEEL